MKEREKKKQQVQTLKKVLKYIERYKVFLVLSLVFAVATVASTLYIPVVAGQVIDHILAPGQVDFGVIFQLLWKMGLIVALTALAQWLMNVCNNKIT